MKTALLGVATVALIGALGGCRDGLKPQVPVILPVSQIEAPASIAAGEPLSVTLIVNIACNNFERYEIHRSASGASIIVWGSNATSVLGYEDVQCTRVFFERHTITFDPPFASTFTVYGNRGRMPAVQVTIEVQ